MQTLYLDNNATTARRPRSLRRWTTPSREPWANLQHPPPGQVARQAIELARAAPGRCSSALDSPGHSHRLGTEAIDLAIRGGCARAGPASVARRFPPGCDPPAPPRCCWSQPCRALGQRELAADLERYRLDRLSCHGVTAMMTPDSRVGQRRSSMQPTRRRVLARQAREDGPACSG